ncbi:glycerol kinase 3-like isoform 1-T2 [Salvelinus alpinus]
MTSLYLSPLTHLTWFLLSWKLSVIRLEILDAMNQDYGVPLSQLQVERGTVLDFQVICVPALGSAMVAGVAEGASVWSLAPGDLTTICTEKYQTQINPEEREFRNTR